MPVGNGNGTWKFIATGVAAALLSGAGSVLILRSSLMTRPEIETYVREHGPYAKDQKRIERELDFAEAERARMDEERKLLARSMELTLKEITAEMRSLTAALNSLQSEVALLRAKMESR
jgi:hypothetical protein